jgi:hypothetical protein
MLALVCVALSGCSSGIVDLATKKELPRKGSNATVNQTDGDTHLAKDLDAMRYFIKPQISKEEYIRESSKGADHWNAYMRQMLSTKADQLASQGRMRLLSNGTTVRILNYYKETGIGASSVFAPLEPGDARAMFAEIEVADGTHKGERGIILTGSLTQ